MKEPSEKARTAAFEVIVSMGKKMNLGGVVKMNLVEGMEDEAKDGISSKLLW
jgi:ribosomal RNA-processing protein 12